MDKLDRFADYLHERWTTTLDQKGFDTTQLHERKAELIRETREEFEKEVAHARSARE